MASVIHSPTRSAVTGRVFSFRATSCASAAARSVKVLIPIARRRLSMVGPIPLIAIRSSSGLLASPDDSREDFDAGAGVD